jgi:hypothetical protein
VTPSAGTPKAIDAARVANDETSQIEPIVMLSSARLDGGVA